MAKGKYESWLSPDGLLRLEGWAREGLTDEQIAKKVGINPATLYDWKKKYSEISNALKKGKEVVDFEVENALLKRALGYKAKEQKITKDGELVEIEKEIPGDVTAQIFWLKNRKPDKWKDRRNETEDNKEDKLDKLFDQIEGALKDAE